jgi:histidinol-phosphatase (PHP family)
MEVNAVPAWPYNYHTHSRYSDGQTTLRDLVEGAAAAGMEALGLSDHGPLGEDTVSWTMIPDRLNDYRAEIEDLAEEYGGAVEVLLGLEADWLPERGYWLGSIRSLPWDYLIGSVHLVGTPRGLWSIDYTAKVFETGIEQLFDGNLQAAFGAYYSRLTEAAGSGAFQVLGHLDLVKKWNRNECYFEEGQSWYRTLVEPVLDAAVKTDTIVEVNTAGLERPAGAFYPSSWIIEQALKRGVRLTLNADAHHPEELQRCFDQVLPQLRALGVCKLWRLQSGNWAPVAI